MNIDIRNSVLSNLNGSSHDDVRKTITEAIQDGDEVTLPGTGVLFELLWRGSNTNEQSRILDILVSELK